MHSGVRRAGFCGGVAVLAALLLTACGGSSKPGAATATGTAVATRAATQPVGGSPATGSPAAACAAVPLTTAIDPQTSQTAQALTPAMLALTDLPPDLHDFGAAGPAPLPVTTGLYAYGHKDATCIVSRLTQDGYLGGIQQTYGKNVTFAPGLQTTFQLLVDLAQFKDAAGAHDALQLMFQNTQQGTQNTAAQQVTVAPLAAGSYGDETQAARGADVFNTQVTVSGTPRNAQGTQVVYTLGWRRGNTVALLTLTAVGQDPSLDDLKALAARQDVLLQQLP